MSFPYGFPGIPAIDFRRALNDDQYRAVTAGNGPVLVLAGAGSGKTRTLTYRVAWLLSQGVRPWEILLLTFTNKAAKEMLLRVEDLTGVPRGEFWGGTFHSIGQRILRSNAEAAGISPSFNIMDSSDADSLFTQIARETAPALFQTTRAKSGSKSKDKESGGLKPRVVLDALSYARNTRRAPAEVFADRFPWVLGSAKNILPEVATAYADSKRAQSLCDYDDLLELWLRLLEQHPDVCRRYQQRFKHILVDEFQDTNKLQSDIVDTLAGDHQVMAVGDDAQCIYTWRGAEFANVADFTARHPGAAIHKIEINYRSTPEILHLANGILSSHVDVASGLSKTLRAERPATGKKPKHIPLLDATEQALFVCRAIREMHEAGRPLADIIVLYRAHYQSLELQMELTRQNIPFTITSGVRFFEQAHVRDLTAHLRFVQNPNDAVAFTRLTALLPRVGPKTALRVLNHARATALRTHTTLAVALTHETVLAKVPEESRDSFRNLAITLQDMETALFGPNRKITLDTPTTPAEDAPAAADSPPTPQAGIPGSDESDLFSDEGDLFAPPTSIPATPPSTAKKSPPTEKASPPPKEPPAPQTSTHATPAEVIRIAIEGWYGDYMRNLYTDWKDRREDLTALIGFAEKYTDTAELLAQIVLLTSETSDKQTNPDAETLHLTTIHQAKGLEFPIVFLIGCAQGQIPLKRAIESGDVSEERRLFYVACTRAKDELYLLAPRLSRSFGGELALLEPSEFITDLPLNTYTTLNLPRIRS